MLRVDNSIRYGAQLLAGVTLKSQRNSTTRTQFADLYTHFTVVLVASPLALAIHKKEESSPSLAASRCEISRRRLVCAARGRLCGHGRRNWKHGKSWEELMKGGHHKCVTAL